MPQESPSRKLDQYIVRFPDGMRDQLKAAAADNNRSLNAEIIARLEASFVLGQAFDELKIESVQQINEVGELVASMSAALERQTQRESELRDLISKLAEGALDTNSRQLKLLEEMAPLASDVHSIIELIQSRPNDHFIGSETFDAAASSKLGKQLAKALSALETGVMESVTTWLRDEGFIDQSAVATLIESRGEQLKQAG